ncbi:acetyl-CoA carboxylase biotin carboxyl carrier protein [Fulvitalea axinellae]|uniref:Biotin carboxyl carrier protein of acetyl-CoA carboxylase n=1 Tax=Fulvitalea axinellae TaxID=1182444 RepID=A0AAU9DHQ4_9BACT|nr:acetyl-CoA carboxylase biotin carboxyl carrier protein [Fulvitalea axinellae]
MKPSEIKNLINFIAQSGLNEVNIETEEFKLSVKRDADSPKVIEQVSVAAPAVAAAPVATAPAAQPAQPAATAPATEAATPADDDSKYITIKSPMIGTFYRSPGPDQDKFVSEGDSVTPEKTVCIVEAMKLFNEINAEVSGKIVKVLIEDATPVEFGTPLFLVDPS